MRAFFLAGFFALASGGITAQVTIAEPELKRHAIGLQANGLINAVLNSGADIGNPYTFRYNYLLNANSAISLGAGFDYGLTEQETGGELRQSDLDMRLGYLYFHNFSEKLRLGFGADIGMQRHNTRSITSQSPPFGDSTVLKTNEINNLLVVGPRITICYHLSEYISIGTEANFYLMRGIEKTEFTATSYDRLSGETLNFFESTDEVSVERFSLGAPVALYLILRL